MLKAAVICPDVHMRESRSEEHTSELQSQSNLVCRLLLENKEPSGRRLRTRQSTPFERPSPRRAPPAISASSAHARCEGVLSLLPKQVSSYLAQLAPQPPA